MEALGITVHFLLIACVLIFPLVLSVRGHGFLRVNLIAIPVCSLLLGMAALWPELFRDIRLAMMGFDFDGMTDTERARNVAPELRDEATRLYWSYMGIGWPLKAIIASIIMLPWPTVAFFLARFTRFVRARLFSDA